MSPRLAGRPRVVSRECGYTPGMQWIRRAESGEWPVWLRYLAFQVPGWGLTALTLMLLASLGWLDAPWPVLLFGAVVLKDAALYPWLKVAHEPSVRHGVEALRRARAIADTPLTPEGVVRVGPERWRARFVGAADRRVGDGERVRVRDVEGLTLLVDTHDEVPPANS